MTLHVAATVGGADATGNPDHPFATIEAALAVAPAYLAEANCYLLIDDSATYTPIAGDGTVGAGQPGSVDPADPVGARSGARRSTAVSRSNWPGTPGWS